MLLPMIFLVIGGALLVKGADTLVEGASGIALKSGVSRIVVGLTIVAFGTSMPELFTSVIAAFRGSSGISFGNIVGSNVVNIAVILGISAMVRPLAVHWRLLRVDIPLMIVLSGFTWWLGWRHDLGRLSGIILLVVFAVYLWRSLQRTSTDIEMDTSETGKSYAVLWLFVALGVVALAGGSYLFVEGARAIARSFGVSETVIGLTIVGLGTSLPELVTSVVASRRNEADISTGNVIGSNIFNIIVVLGVSVTLRPFALTPDRFMDLVALPLMFGLAVIMLPFSITGARISRWEGAVLAVVGVGYFVAAVVMG